ncbi:MAG: helix-turn-helix domain-containing protein [Lachnospiraceae bacterium]|nr:helix-turn-helix domain-containing protein [Lachnospiraceae bacterium]
MGRKSSITDKNIYLKSREEAGLTRLQASERMKYVTEGRIEKIESEKSSPHPDEVMAMAEVYKKPALCNHYCSTECPIGIKNVPPVESKDLSQIILEMLATLNHLNDEKNRMIEITADGLISDSEIRDFVKIKGELTKISATIDSLQLWIDNKVAEGKLDARQITT